MSAPFPLPLLNGHRARILPWHDASVGKPEGIEVEATPALQRQQFLSDSFGHGFPDDNDLSEVLEQAEEGGVCDQLPTHDQDRPPRPPAELPHAEQDVEHAEMADLGGPFLRNEAQLTEWHLQRLKQPGQFGGQLRRGPVLQFRLRSQRTLVQPDADFPATDMRDTLAREITEIKQTSRRAAEHIQIVRQIVCRGSRCDVLMRAHDVKAIAASVEHAVE